MSALSMTALTPDMVESAAGFDFTSPGLCPYEQSREERIRENLQRMQSLGIFDLSLKLKAHAVSALKPKNRYQSAPKANNSTPVRSTGPVRRSSRLQNVTPASYSEVVEVNGSVSTRNDRVKLLEGPRHEVYTDEHEKLLGNTERNWTFFVDGYDKNGKRIYDPIRGKTCHQCRQKTLGYRTHCIQCNMVQGQFCGDCLYMRYGEHVLEALENENWICPVCRGICNCSLCRTSKGWAPTGAIYRKISNLGYKSVAHYLIQTKREVKETEEEFGQASAKRSLSFPATEAPDSETTQEPAGGEEEGNDPSSAKGCTLSDAGVSDQSKSKEKTELTSGENYSNPSNKEKERKKRRCVVPNPDSIGARLRRKR